MGAQRVNLGFVRSSQNLAALDGAKSDSGRMQD